MIKKSILKYLYVFLFFLFFLISKVSAITNIDLDEYKKSNSGTQVLQIIKSEYQILSENSGKNYNSGNYNTSKITKDDIINQIKQKRSKKENIIGLCILFFIGLLAFGIRFSKK